MTEAELGNVPIGSKILFSENGRPHRVLDLRPPNMKIPVACLKTHRLTFHLPIILVYILETQHTLGDQA